MSELATEGHPSEEELRLRLQQERADAARAFVPPEPEEPDPADPDPETDEDEPEEPLSFIAQVQARAGDEPPPDPATETCPTCRGWGEVQTGSMVDGARTRPCYTCSSTGWVLRSAQPVQPPPPAEPAEAPAPGYVPDFARPLGS